MGQLFDFFQSYTGANIWKGMKDELPLSIGMPIIVGMFIFLVYIFLENRKIEEKINIFYKESCAYMGITSLALFMSSYYFPWDMLSSWSLELSNIIAVIQFPWRYLTIASVVWVALCVSTLKYLLE